MTADIRVQFSFWTLVWSCGANLLQLTSPRCWGTLAGRSSTRDLASRSVVDRGRGWTSHCGMSVFILGYFLAIGIELNLAAAAFYGIRPLTSTWEFSFALWGKKKGRKNWGIKSFHYSVWSRRLRLRRLHERNLFFSFFKVNPKGKPRTHHCVQSEGKNVDNLFTHSIHFLLSAAAVVAEPAASALWHHFPESWPPSTATAHILPPTLVIIIIVVILMSLGRIRLKRSRPPFSGWRRGHFSARCCFWASLLLIRPEIHGRLLLRSMES